MDYKIAVVDFDPTTSERLPKRGAKHFYGDAANVEFLQELPLKRARLAISSIPDIQANTALITFLKSRNSKLIVLAFSQNKQEAVKLYDAGADYVVIPHHLAAQHIAKLIGRVGFEVSSFTRKQLIHLQELQKRVA